MALPIAGPARRVIAGSIAAMRSRLSPTQDAALRWVSADAFHVTLRFLGATDPGRLDGVVAAVQEAAARSAPFDAATGSMALLGGRRSPTVVLELTTGVDEVVRLEADLSVALAGRGWPPPERAIRPHLTLARGRSAGNARLAATVMAGDVAETVPWRVERVALFESRLGRGAPRYVERAASALQG